MRFPSHLGRNVVIAVALLAAGFFAAYLRFLPYLAHESRYTDGREVYELSEIDQLRFAVWDEPVPLPPTVNTSGTEGRAALSPDGTLLVFAVGEPGLNVDLWVADLVDGEPVDPRPLDRVNSIGDDLAPAFARDALLFASNRPGSRGFDLWRAGYADGVFEAPERVPGPLNTEHDETDPAPVPGTVALVFASDRPRGMRADLDLYVAVPRGAGTGRDADWEVTPFEEVNTPFDEREPALTSDALGIVFASDRDGGPGGFDLFHSVQSGGAWQEPERLKGLNTERDERGPALGGDGFTLLYTVAGEDDGGELVRARSLELFRLPGRRVGWLDLTLLGLLLLLALLAWLGRKWETLDVLYKCLLVSLLAHLLLMWWFRDVFMDREAMAIEEGAPTFQVKLAPSTTTLARSQERAGHLDVAAARGDLPAVPDRDEPMAPRPVVEARPEAAALAPERLAEARDTTALDARRGPVAAAGRARVADRAAVPVALPDVQVERHAGGAPQLALDARPVQQAPATATGRLPAERSSTGMLTPGTASIGVSRPAVGTLARPAADAGVPSLQTRSQGEAPAPQHRTTAGAVAVVQPGAEIERHAGSAPQVGLQARAIEAMPSTPGEPRRAGRATTELPPASAALAVGTPGTADLPRPAPVTDETPVASSRQAAAVVRPDRAAAERPVAVAQPSALPAATAGADPAAQQPSGLDLSSFASSPPPEGPRRGGRLPGRRSVHAPAAAPTNAAPDARSLRPATATAAAPAPTFRPRPDATADRPARGLPAVALEDLPVDTPVPGHQTSPAGEPRHSGPASAASDGPVLDARTLAAERDLDAVATPGRFRLASDADEMRPGGALPAFRPLAMATVASTIAPRRIEPVRDKYEHTPYRTRFGEAKVKALEEHGGSADTEVAVVSGLSYLAGVQHADGFWGDADDYQQKYGEMRVGKTALALLAFLGAGHTPASGTQYSENTERAVRVLLGCQDPETGHFGRTASYSHAIATYALAECRALTGDERLRPPLERAVDWILRQQHRHEDPRFHGGWGYYYPDGRVFDRWPRTSVTVWQVMALESARLGGLDVPDRAFDDARTFLLNAHDKARGVVRYVPAPVQLDSAYETLPGSTPAGLFALSLLGEDLAHVDYDNAIDWVLAKAPSSYKDGGADAFVMEAQGNLYFWYYGTLSMFRHGGDSWAQWNRRLQRTLLPAQAADGSWEPISLYAKYVGDTDEDRTYSTAMCVLTLEVYYRYFTPLLHVR